jgi:hypothetical protein
MSSTPAHISLNNSTVTINHFTSPIPKLLSTNENVYHQQQNGNGVLISPSTKQNEACQSVPRSPQHRHQLYSNEQQQFISIPHTPVYLDLQPFPSNTTSTEIPYSDNGSTTTTASAYYFTSYPSSTNNNVIDYQQPVRL